MHLRISATSSSARSASAQAVQLCRQARHSSMQAGQQIAIDLAGAGCASSISFESDVLAIVSPFGLESTASTSARS